MILGSLCQRVRCLFADLLAHFRKPQPCPGKFHAEYGKTDRNDDERRPRREKHDEAETEHRESNHRDCDSTRHFIGQMNGFSDHVDLPSGPYYATHLLFRQPHSSPNTHNFWTTIR